MISATSAGLNTGTDSDRVEAIAPVLAVVAPAGMTSADRQEWLIAAAVALREVPLDLLRVSCRKLACVVDHPSKIVKAIFDDTKLTTQLRQDSLRRWNRLLPTTPPADSEAGRIVHAVARNLSGKE